jgi:hypothetical protein
LHASLVLTNKQPYLSPGYAHILLCQNTGKVPLLELGPATSKQLQTLQEHPAMQGAFTACVLRAAVLKASVASSGMTENNATQHLEMAAAQAQELEAAGLVQVRGMSTLWLQPCHPG